MIGTEKFFLLLTLSSILFCGKGAATITPSQVRESVAFLLVRGNAPNQISYGTGFFVDIENEENPATFTTYFVTARHTLINKRTGRLPDSVFIQLNRKKGDTWTDWTKEIPFADKAKYRAYVHKDPTVDLAVIRIPSNELSELIRPLPADMIATKETTEEANIQEGGEVFFIPPFIIPPDVYPSYPIIYPIVRFGHISLMTDGKIPMPGPIKMLELYLIDAQSVEGYSGAPVFFYFGPAKAIMLAGVMKGGCFVLGSNQDIDVSAVVPSYKLYELLFSEELRQSRSEKPR